MSSSRAFESAAQICAARASSSLPWLRMDSRIAARRSSNSRRYRSRSSRVRSWASSSAPVASFRYRAMNGTVAPPSSSSIAAVTCPSSTPSSVAIRSWMAVVVVTTSIVPPIPDRGRRDPPVRAAPTGPRGSEGPQVHLVVAVGVAAEVARQRLERDTGVTHLGEEGRPVGGATVVAGAAQRRLVLDQVPYVDLVPADARYQVAGEGLEGHVPPGAADRRVAGDPVAGYPVVVHADHRGRPGDPVADVHLRVRGPEAAEGDIPPVVADRRVVRVPGQLLAGAVHADPLGPAGEPVEQEDVRDPDGVTGYPVGRPGHVDHVPAVRAELGIARVVVAPDPGAGHPAPDRHVVPVVPQEHVAPAVAVARYEVAGGRGQRDEPAVLADPADRAAAVGRCPAQSRRDVVGSPRPVAEARPQENVEVLVARVGRGRPGDERVERHEPPAGGDRRRAAAAVPG